MPRNCPRCAQVNPEEALYCWLDGAALDGPAPAARPVPVGAQPFPFPFVFPSGQSCRNFDELTLACEDNWIEAWELLREGLLESFFDGLGRADLAAAARRCAGESDPDVGLDGLLAQFPGEARKPPHLAVHPHEFNLGQITPGTNRSFDLCLNNQGMGLLTGWVVSSGADWLALGDGAGVAHKVFQCRDEAHLTVRIVGDRLRAGRRQEGQLFVGSSGGPARVVVRVETPVAPFAGGVLTGADSPRALAAKAKAAPREAAAYFENGAVAAWYQANGWTYPVQGPQAPGVAAVQQFFEALGLSAPPRLDLDRLAVELEGPPGAPLETMLTLQAREERPIFVHAVSLAPWLTIGPAALAGRSARVPLRIAAVPDRPGERLLGQVQLTGNGNQHFIVEVALTVTGRRRDDRWAGVPVLEDGAPTSEPTQVPLPDAAAPHDPPTGAPAPPFLPDAPASRPGPWMWVAAGGLLSLALAAVVTVTALAVLWGDVGASPGDPPPAPPPAPQEAAGVWEDAPAGAPFEGHSAPVLAAAVTADGQLLTASGGVVDRDGQPVLSADNAVHVWDAASGRELRRLRGFKGGVATAAFSANGRRAAVAAFGGDRIVHLWDLLEGRELRALSGHTAEVVCIAFTPDGGRVVSGGAGGAIHVWEVESGDPVCRLTGHNGSVNSVAVSADGHYALSGGDDHTVRLWDLRRRREIRQFPGHKDIVWATALSPDGRLALSAGGGDYNAGRTDLTLGARDFDVRLWEVASGKELRRFSGHTNAVGVAIFSPNGERVLTAGNDNAVCLWRTSDGKKLGQFEGHKALVRCGAFFADGRRAVTGGDDALLKVWDVPAGASALVKLLEGGDAGERLRAARDLADCGAEAAMAVPLLLKGLMDGDGDFRREALLTLPKIGAPTRAEVDLLEDLVKDAAFPAGRDYALDALAALGPGARPAALAVYRVLMDANADAAARCKAARCLGALGPNAEVRAFADLFKALGDPNPKVSEAVADALGKLCPPGKDDVTDLEMHLKDGSAAVRRYALRALTAVGPDARAAAPYLADVLARDPLADLRLAALKALLGVAPNDGASVEAFATALADADPSLPPEAVKALAQAGPDHGALPALIQALAHKDDAVRKAAEDALKAARLAPAHVGVLGDALKKADPAVRERLMGVLEALGPDAGEAVDGLCQLLRDGPADLRRRAVDLLVKTGPTAKKAGPALAALLDDKDRSVRFQAALALANIGAEQAKDAVRLLVNALWVEKQEDAASVAARDKAREALATIGEPAVKALTAALAGDFADGPQAPNSEANAWARLTAVQALKEMGPAARSRETCKLLDSLEKKDPALDVREAAREALAAIGRPD